MEISKRFEKLCLDRTFFLAKQNNLSDDMTKLQREKCSLVRFNVKNTGVQFWWFRV
jgi:hypothetical protein